MPAYMIRADDDGAVKIGWSKNVVSRSREIRPTPSTELSVIRLIGCSEWIEDWLHKQFVDRRIKGEWFTFDDRMLTIEVPEAGSIELPLPKLPPAKPKNQNYVNRRDPHFNEFLMRWHRVSQLAAAAGVTKQAVSQWKRIPEDKAPLIARALGVPLHELRPDLWSPPVQAVPQEPT